VGRTWPSVHRSRRVRRSSADPANKQCAAYVHHFAHLLRPLSRLLVLLAITVSARANYVASRCEARTTLWQTQLSCMSLITTSSMFRTFKVNVHESTALFAYLLHYLLFLESNLPDPTVPSPIRVNCLFLKFLYLAHIDHRLKSPASQARC